MFVGLVVIHEIGHFIVARRNRVEVEEFGIGFPPRAKVLKKKNGTLYTLNWLPLGGFVKLKGEHDSSRSPGSFGAAKLGAKVRIILAGVFMNFLVAAALFTILALTGMPKAQINNLPFYDKEQFSVTSDTKIIRQQVRISVMPDFPAAKAGLQDGDELIKIGEEPITRADQVRSVTERYKGEAVDIVYRRAEGPEQTVQATLNDARTKVEQDGQQFEVGYLGLGAMDDQSFRATWSAPIVGVGTAVQFGELSFRGLGYVLQNLFQGKPGPAGEAVGGPVATFKVISDVSSIGLDRLLFVIALISVSLAVMNVLPIPALDGGRLFVTLLFRAIRKPLTKDMEDLVHGIGFVVLIGLIILITIIDIKRLV